MKKEDNKTLEKVAEVLIRVDKNLISDRRAIKEIMKIVVENSNKKLKEYLDKSLRGKNNENNKTIRKRN